MQYWNGYSWKQSHGEMPVMSSPATSAQFEFDDSTIEHVHTPDGHVSVITAEECESAVPNEELPVVTLEELAEVLLPPNAEEKYLTRKERKRLEREQMRQRAVEQPTDESSPSDETDGVSE